MQMRLVESLSRLVDKIASWIPKKRDINQHFASRERPDEFQHWTEISNDDDFRNYFNKRR